MIDVYTWPTPNGHKVHIMLEECGFKLGRDWQAHAVNIGQGDQFKPEFLNILKDLPIFYQPMKIEFLNSYKTEFDNQILDYVSRN